MSKAEQTQGSTGRLLAGRYRLGEVLGRGGMGTVWRAKDETLGRTVAVKELRFSSTVDEDEKRRLITRTLREAKAIARIRSTGAVTVYDVVNEDDRPWIVMELIEGSSLADVVRERGGLTPHRTAEVGLAVLDVLRAAHREGILHRDVKPSNVLISDDGRVVLTDFGIAQVEGDPSVTSTGMLVGAPSYISPERARGHKPGPPADLWSLGGLLYACVEGVPPYDKGSALATLTAVMTEPVDPPKNAGPLEEVIYGLLAKDPGQRLDDAGARALLEDALSAPEDQGPQAPEPTRTMMLPTVSVEEKPVSSQAASSKAAARKPASRRPSFSKPSLSKPSLAKAAKPESTSATSTSAESESAHSAAAKSASPEPAANPGTGPGAAGPDAGQDPAAGPDAKPEATSVSRAEVEERLRGALRSVRNAAVAAKAKSASMSRPSAASSEPGPGGGDPARRTTGVSLTDVVPRRTLVIVAVIAALAVLGAVLAFALNNGGDSGSSGSGSPKDGQAASSGAQAGSGDSGRKDTGEKSGEGGKDGKEGKGQPSDARGDTAGGEGQDKEQKPKGEQQKPEDQGKGQGLPEGFKTVINRQFHFSMGMPEDWKLTGIAGRNSGGIFSKSGGFPRIQIDYSPEPGTDAAAAWRSLEPAVRSQSTGYRLLGIKEVDYRGYPTVADWSFERKQDGRQVRVLNRGFKADSAHGYSIMITCRKDAWDGEECTKVRDTAFKTFQPKD
ncbi:protein kinase domain-containing protein [Streptomyces sp. 8N706]|uniref:protein kinase domain-containing protein n=1 Tax=Streptomyces sp. 8N706 TaxID=3457416 RepID=UPI003FD14F82